LLLCDPEFLAIYAKMATILSVYEASRQYFSIVSGPRDFAKWETRMNSHLLELGSGENLHIGHTDGYN